MAQERQPDRWSTRPGVRRAIVGLLLLAVASVSVAAWNLDLLVIVVSTPAAAVTLVVQERVAELSVARRAAALALAAPDGVADASAMERMVTSDLASMIGPTANRLTPVERGVLGSAVTATVLILAPEAM